jgi:hypothetical protein
MIIAAYDFHRIYIEDVKVITLESGAPRFALPARWDVFRSVILASSRVPNLYAMETEAHRKQSFSAVFGQGCFTKKSKRFTG